jgi:hypothetical protein
MANDRIFEVRTYHSSPGNLQALSSRFRDHTVALFAEHGFGVTGLWIAPDEDDATTGTLVYILNFASREAAAAAWAEFRADERWLSARAASEIPNGTLTSSIESKFMSPTDYSEIR